MMNYDAIANKIEEMIKADIKEKGLINTGAMYNSIQVDSTGDGDYSTHNIYWWYSSSSYWSRN
jgi:hypothetical protein